MINLGRKEELIKLTGNSSELMEQLVDEILYMETQLKYYRSLPQIRVDKERPERQRATPAAKLYKETMQQYTNCIKIIARGNAYKLIARQDVQQYIAYLRYLQSVNPTSPILHIATINEIQGFWTNVMDSNRYDIKDRLRASELLAKSIGAFDEF